MDCMLMVRSGNSFNEEIAVFAACLLSLEVVMYRFAF